MRHGRTESALAIIQHARWEEAMGNVDERGITPMKRMIVLMPEAALAALNVWWCNMALCACACVCVCACVW